MNTVLGVFAAVLNSLWQAAIVAALVFLVLKLMARLNVPFNAATRYVIWWAALAVVLVLPAGPHMMEWWHARTQKAPAAATRPVPAPVSTATPLPDPPVIVTLQQDRAARWPLWIVALWAVLCLYRLSQLGRSYLYLRGVKRRAAISPQALPAIRRPARLLVSSEIASPMAVGFLRPAVVLPESLAEEITPQELDHVLLHETAHIARRDDWTNLAARLLGAALALHPVAVWILRQIDRERETACDDWVVAKTGAARLYAASLARMFELRSARRGEVTGEALASGMFGGGSRLGERIEMLLKRGREFSPRASMARVAVSALVLLALVVAGSLAPRWVAFAQVEPRLAFEAASIKPSDPGHVGAQAFSPGPGRFTAMTATLKDLVGFAYRVEPHQILGVPLDSGRFDITAKAESAATNDQLKHMLQTLLADRFHVRFHRETKELPIYDLVTEKNGPKLREVSSPGLGVAGSPGLVNGRGADMPTLASVLSCQLGRSVVDKTEIMGFYEFTLRWTPDDSQTADAADPGVFTAIQEQLGLRLKPAKGPVEILVIDHAEKPDAN